MEWWSDGSELDGWESGGMPGGLVCLAGDVAEFPDFSGGAERIEAWLVFGSRDGAVAAEAALARYLELVVAVLHDGGFPAEALPSFRVYFTSEQEIEERGGRFAFFR